MPDLTKLEDRIFAGYNRYRRNPLTRAPQPDSLTRDPKRTLRLLQQLGVDNIETPAVVVTGSKGKGSTAIFCATLLQSSGLRVGLLTSPELLSHRERIRLNGCAIPPDMYERLLHTTLPAVDRVEASLQDDQYLSPNGIFLAIALQYWRDETVDAIVLEAGRGGTYDDTVIVPHRVTVVTPIFAEHLDQLGPTLEQVARNKAGLISLGGMVVSADQIESVATIIGQVAQAQGAAVSALDEIRRAIVVEPIDTADISPGMPARITLQYADGAIQSFDPPVASPYLHDNFLLAWQAAQLLMPDIRFDSRLIARLRLIGRSQQVRARPEVWLDGAIDRVSATAFIDGLPPASLHGKIWLITALPTEKDVEGFFTTMRHFVARVTIVHAGSHLHYDDEALRDTLHRLMPSLTVSFAPTLEYALNGHAAVGASSAIDTDEAIWIVGTQSLVRDAARIFAVDTECLLADEPVE